MRAIHMNRSDVPEMATVYRFSICAMEHPIVPMVTMKMLDYVQLVRAFAFAIAFRSKSEHIFIRDEFEFSCFELQQNDRL